MSLILPEKVGKLQKALHTKAKESPSYRFYMLYDKVYRRDILEHAFHRCRVNDGAPGIDGQRFADIEAYGEETWLDELADELRKKTYPPKPVRRVFIPKGDGKQRPLGIGTIRDRVVQMAVVLVLEPIFEADLEPEQHAYRPDRSALDAVRQVHGLLDSGHTDVVDADLSGYSMMSKLRLTVNETKTRLCHVPQESVDFLGYTIGRCYSPRTGYAYIGTKPSSKKIAALKAEIHELTSRRWLWTTVEDRVAKLNQKLLEWSNYFCLGPVTPAYQAIDRHARHRLRQWLQGKHKGESRGTSRFPDARLNAEFGLIRLVGRPRSHLWAKG